MSPHQVKEKEKCKAYLIPQIPIANKELHNFFKR